MKLLAVVPTGELSGAERVLLRYLRAAADAGWEVRCLVPEGRCAAALDVAGIATLPLPPLDVPTGPRAAALARLTGRWRAAARLVREAAADADAVLVNGFLALPAVRLARVAAPVAWLVHDVVRKPEWRLLLRACAPAVAMAFAVSDGAAGPVRAAGIPARVVRNGTVWPVDPARPAPGVPVVGVNAALTSWKGQDVLLEAVSRLDVPVCVELMGGQFARDAPFADALRARAARSDLAGRVTFVGHVADPLARMRTWTVAVSSSVGPEAAPLNVLEAMSIGLPMVATGHGGTFEVLGGAGLLVPPGDPAAMAAALRRLLTEPDLHARCAAAGPAAVAAGLRLEDAAADFLLALAGLFPPAVPAPPPDHRRHRGARAVKVLFVNENIGGHSTTHLHIQRALAGHPDVAARFLTVPPRGALRKLLGAPVPGLARHDLDLQPLRNQLLVSAWTRRHLGPAIAAFRPDVVHVFTHNAALLSTGVLAGLPAVVAMDGTNAMNAYRLPYRNPTRFTPRALRPTTALERRVYEVADLVVPNSNYTARSLRDDYGVDPDRIRVIPYGITAPTFDEPAAPGARAASPRIVFVGRGIERKGGFRLLDLHQRYLADRCELVLVTPDEVPPGRNVTVVDDVRPGDGKLWEVLREASVFVLPSRIDQLSNAVMEGMAAGLPVVAHPIVAIADMVDPGVTGFLPPENDDAALVAAIATLVDDPALREKMGAAGRARFEAHYDAGASTARLLDVLHEAVTRHAHRAGVPA